MFCDSCRGGELGAAEGWSDVGWAWLEEEDGGAGFEAAVSSTGTEEAGGGLITMDGLRICGSKIALGEPEGDMVLPRRYGLELKLLV